ncbi:MAG: pitrilysin family protein, partial [Candidatus Neomarinimicrobiota bacterium]
MMKNKIKNVLISLRLIILITPFICAAQSLPKGVSIHILDNGLQVLLIENPALPMVGVNTVVKVGSAYETFATSGMSHMLEHLLFNGTSNRTQKQLYDDTDRIGGYNNANTSEYFTNYMMVTPTDNIVNGMEIQADMLFNSILPEGKFQKEKRIILEEISKSLSSPAEQLNRNLISILYKGHALSLPTLGTYTTIEAMRKDIVYKYYKNNYVPNNMILSVIGNFNTDDMLNNINNIFGKYPPREVTSNINGNWSVGLDNEFLSM